MPEAVAEKPRYTHDCPACQFLGHYKEYDLYFCDNEIAVFKTVIARFGNEGPEYASGMPFGEAVLAGKKPIDFETKKEVPFSPSCIALGAALLKLKAKQGTAQLVAEEKALQTAIAEADAELDQEPID